MLSILPKQIVAKLFLYFRFISFEVTPWNGVAIFLDTNLTSVKKLASNFKLKLKFSYIIFNNDLT